MREVVGVALADALREWEARWVNIGMPIEDELLPGVDEATVRAALPGEDVHPDVLTWFAWHGGSWNGWAAVPSGRHLLRPEELVSIRAVLEDVERRGDGLVSQFKQTYLPLLQEGHEPMIVIDQADGAMYVHGLHLVPEPRFLRVADSLESLVRIWIGVCDTLDLVFGPDGYIVAVDTDALPPELVRTSIVF